ncbi:MAG TPA: signal peptidase I [Jatrophihabitans sp.]|nr:signal peptidase I [Jatrophihabitans sp.]
MLVVLGAGLSGALLYHNGYRLYVVHTGSMVPTYNPGDVVLDRPASRPVPGEVITFRTGPGSAEVVTHRVVSVSQAGMIHTKGDANATADAWVIQPDMVRGVAVRPLRNLGYLLVFLRQPFGIAALATGTFALYLLWGLFFGDEPSATEQSPDPPRRGRAPRHGMRTAPHGHGLPASRMVTPTSLSDLLL